MCLFSLRKLFCDLFALFFFCGFVLFCSSISAAEEMGTSSEAFFKVPILPYMLNYHRKCGNDLSISAN